MYLDDKISTNAQTNGIYRLTEITQSAPNSNVQNVQVKRVYDKYTPMETYYFVALLRTQQPTGVTVDGNALPFINVGSDNGSAQALAQSTVNAYYYNQSLQAAFVKVFDVSADTTISAAYS